MAVALRQGDSYRIEAPDRVGELTTFFERVERAADSGSILAGFDFPIGLPLSYARKLHLGSFLNTLLELGSGDWEDFYEPACRAGEISLRRPFYPRAPGGTSHQHLIDALGVTSISELRRHCERATSTRSAACPLFWTLGGNQVGRAAITGWRDLLAPALRARRSEVAVWPFEGAISALLAHYRFVVAETYPAEACSHVGLPRPGIGWSKRSQLDRRAQASRLLDWTEVREVNLSDDLRDAIDDGFSARKDGEDAFDAVVGLMSMIEVATGHRSEGMPIDPEVRALEGWILGQQAPTPAR